MSNNAALASEVIAKFGYLVFAYQDEVKIGGIIQSEDVSGAEVLAQPFSVIGETTQLEYIDHQRFLREIGGEPDYDPEEWPHYYRVITD